MSEPTRKATRFVIEGTWSGYRSGQERVAHVSVHKVSEKRLRAWAESTHAITYTDGTSLWISVRDAKPREVVKECRGYMSLIRDCAYFGVTSVAAVLEAKRMQRERASKLSEVQS